MRLSRSTRLRVIVLAVFALLFSQASVAAYACKKFALSDAMPVVAQVAIDMPADASIDAESMTTAIGDSGALCAQHCNADAQASDAPPLLLPMPLDATALWPCGAAADGDGASLPRRDATLARAITPPLTLLYCVSLT
jgi:hypothetical protein